MGQVNLPTQCTSLRSFIIQSFLTDLLTYYCEIGIIESIESYLRSSMNYTQFWLWYDWSYWLISCAKHVTIQLANLNKYQININVQSDDIYILTSRNSSLSTAVINSSCDKHKLCSHSTSILLMGLVVTEINTCQICMFIN